MEEIAENHETDHRRQQGSSRPRRKPPSSALSQHQPQPNKHSHSTSTEERVKLAAVAISSNIRLRSADMPFAMQERALPHARAVLDPHCCRRPNPTLLTRSLKKEFDRAYGPAWQCVAGSKFGSFVTHSPGGFVYFSVDSLFFLLFKTEVHLITRHSPPN